jgi:hypothetical protein
MPAGSFGSPYSDENLRRINTPQMPTKQYGNPNTFTSAANQQAKDYDKIMGMYEDVYNQGKQNPLTFNPVTGQTTQYSKSADVTKSLGDLSELSSTGGYSAQGIQDLRSRGVSPIRASYANAERNINRGRSLSGGYSPNSGALRAKMAREQGDLLSQRMTDINAGIAQNVATNRLSAAPAYSGAAQRENEARTGVDTKNADIMNDIAKFNASGSLDAQRSRFNNQLGAVEGMRGLYGTTPALTNLFGQQISDTTRLGQSQQEINNRNKIGQMSTLFGNRNG